MFAVVIDFITVPLLCAEMAAAVYSLMALDRLIRTEYEDYHAQWMADGEPTGVFWRAEGRRNGNNVRALRGVSWAWLVRRPVWVADCSRSVRLLIAYRVAFYVLLAVVLAFSILLFLVLFVPDRILGP